MNLALDINVILVQPQYAINVGYTARLCKIFQVKELIVVSPACDIYCHEAQLAATHGEHNLKNSIVVHKLSEARKYCHTLAAFSAQVGGQHLCSSILRTPWDVEDFAKQICSRSSERKPACTDKGPCQNEVCNSNSYSVGLVFGREASGLLNTEIKTCDFLVIFQSRVGSVWFTQLQASAYTYVYSHSHTERALQKKTRGERE